MSLPVSKVPAWRDRNDEPSRRKVLQRLHGRADRQRCMSLELGRKLIGPVDDAAGRDVAAQEVLVRNMVEVAKGKGIVQRGCLPNDFQ